MTENYFEIDKDGNVTVSEYLQAIFPDLTYTLGDDMRSILVDYGDSKCASGQNVFVRSTSDGNMGYTTHALPAGPTPIPYISFDVETKTLTMDVPKGIYEKATMQGYVDQFMSECSTLVPFVEKLVFYHWNTYDIAHSDLTIWLDGGGELLLPNLRHFEYGFSFKWSNIDNDLLITATSYERDALNSFYHGAESGVLLWSATSSNANKIPKAFWELADEHRGSSSDGLDEYEDPLVNLVPCEGINSESSGGAYDIDLSHKKANWGGTSLDSIAGLVGLANNWTEDLTLFGYDADEQAITELTDTYGGRNYLRDYYPLFKDVTGYVSKNFRQLNLILPFPALESYYWDVDARPDDFVSWELSTKKYEVVAINYISSYGVVLDTTPLSADTVGKIADIDIWGMNYDMNASMNTDYQFIAKVRSILCDLAVDLYADTLIMRYLNYDDIIFYWNRMHQSVGAYDANHLNYLWGGSASSDDCWWDVDTITIFDMSDYSGLTVKGDIYHLWTEPRTMTVPTAVMTAYPNLLTINGIPINPNWFAIGIEAGTVVWDDVEIWNQAWRWHDDYKAIVTRNTPTIDDGVNLLEMPKTIDELTVTIDGAVGDPTPYENLHSVAYRVANLDTELSEEYLKVMLGMTIETACCSHGVTVYFWWNDTVDDYKDYVRGIVSNFQREDPPADLTNVKKLLVVSLDWLTIWWEKNDAFDAHGIDVNLIYPLKVTYRITTGDGLTGKQPLTIQPIYKYQDGTEAPSPDVGVCTAHGVTGVDYHV